MDQEAEVTSTEAPAAPAGEQQQTGETVEKQGESATPPGDTPAEPPKKKGGGFQKRIDKLTQRNYELESRLAALEGNRTQAPADDKEPKREDFDSLEDFNRALVRHNTKIALKEENEARQKAERERQSKESQERNAERWSGHTESAADKYEDGAEIIEHFTNEVVLHPFALGAINDSDIGGDLAYFLGKNEKEAERIGKLSPYAQVREIGKLEAKLAATPVKKASNAPAPIAPVGGKGGDIGLDDNMSTEQWIKRRQKQVHAKG